MGLIDINGGNHVLRRSLIDACGLAGQQAIADVQTHVSSAVPAARVEPSPGDAASPTPDVAIVLDASLIPGQEMDLESTVRRVSDLGTRCRRVVLACSFAHGHATAALGQWSSDRDVIIVRTAPVYGIANDAVTLFLIMMRSLPAVPVLRDTRRGQPIWHRDLARALVAAALLPANPHRRVLDVAGPDATTHEQLYERIAVLIDRRPLSIPVPDFVARHGARLANSLGVAIPIDAALESFFTSEMAASDNALESVLDVAPTGLDEGLRQLIVGLDEVTPAEGVGSVQLKRFWAHIAGSSYEPAALLQVFRERFGEIMPIPVGVEPAAPARTLEEGAVITMTLPGRGHVQVRVQDVTSSHVIVATLRGHAIAGIVRFSARRHGSFCHFEVTTCDAAANVIDWLALSLGGARIQDANWTRVVQNVVELSGGTSEGVSTSVHTLTPGEADEAEQWIDRVIHSMDAR